jgi:hypothetical protein
MSAVGPAFPRDPAQACTFNVHVTVGAGDVAASSIFNSKQIRQITCGGSGILYLQGAEDSAAVPFYVSQGQIIQGIDFSLIGGTTNYPSATAGLEIVASY